MVLSDYQWQQNGFFHSTRGLKQGDPLSPSLFILGAEVLSRRLNSLITNVLYSGFSMNRKGPQITHLEYADDVIIFTSGSNISLGLIEQELKNYQDCSGQLINESKGCFLIDPDSPVELIQRVKRVTSYRQVEFPITYLGCPLYIGRKKNHSLAIALRRL